MSLGFIAAGAPVFEGLPSLGLTPRMNHGQYANLHARNTSETPNTVNLFLDVTEDDYEFAASVITACVDQTIYALQCTSASGFVGGATCGPNAAVS